MDSGRKRKATQDTSSSQGVKKIRLLNTNHASDDVQSAQSEVQRVGFKLLDQLDRATDKFGRKIATMFKELPSKEDLPDYYTFTRLPIAMETIRAKLEQGGYPTITTIESDVKRMVQNAKDYNTAGSDIYEDAERIRKLAYNFMKNNNPEYTTNPNYASFPTPIPDSASASSVPAGRAVAKENVESSSRRQRRSTGVSDAETPESKSQVHAAAASDKNGQIPAVTDDFTNKTFQEAQEMIISGLLEHTDQGGLEIYSPFANLPSRKLEDYYKLIRHPVSIKGVLKRIRGIHGREAPTGITDYKTWDAFEDGVSWIWRNAREYNEDASDMYILAGEFEEDFKNRLAAAKSKVEEPSAPKLKLGGPKPKVTLNLSQHRGSPGVGIDSEALARQKQHVSAGVNGYAADYRASPVVNGGSRPGTATVDGRPESGYGSHDSDRIKLEHTQSPGPGLAAASNTALTNGHTMLPPTARLLSESPMPNGQPSSYTFTAPTALPPTPLRPYPVADSLMPDIKIATHPQLKLETPFSVSIKPHETLSVHSCTFTLPSTHYFVQITPTISRNLSMGRPYKMFVTVNGSRLTQRDTMFNQDTGCRTHVYEGSLAPGVNRIEVEVAAAKEGQYKGLDIEKLVVFASLMKP